MSYIKRIDELVCAEDNYRTLRVALRNAILRITGTRVDDVSGIFRQIESGMSVGDATDAFEKLLYDVGEDYAVQMGLRD